MADIELVIKMPEAEYDECIMQVKMIEQEGIYYESSNYTLKKYIANGIPLPEGHGDLKDMDEIIEKIRKLPNAGVHWFINAESVFNTILDAPTIIKANSESEDKE